MTKVQLRRSCAFAAIAVSLSATPVLAQDGEEPDTDNTIIVTGSLIRGTPEDSALPHRASAASARSTCATSARPARWCC